MWVSCWVCSRTPNLGVSCGLSVKYVSSAPKCSDHCRQINIIKCRVKQGQYLHVGLISTFTMPASPLYWIMNSPSPTLPCSHSKLLPDSYLLFYPFFLSGGGNHYFVKTLDSACNQYDRIHKNDIMGMDDKGKKKIFHKKSDKVWAPCVMNV